MNSSRASLRLELPLTHAPLCLCSCTGCVFSPVSRVICSEASPRIGHGRLSRARDVQFCLCLFCPNLHAIFLEECFPCHGPRSASLLPARPAQRVRAMPHLPSRNPISTPSPPHHRQTGAAASVGQLSMFSVHATMSLPHISVSTPQRALVVDEAGPDLVVFGCR